MQPEDRDRSSHGVAIGTAVVLAGAFLLGYWGKMSVLRPSGWFASSWLPYVFGAWVIVRTERRPARAGAYAAAAMLGIYWAVEIGLGLRFSPINWSAPIDESLFLGALLVAAAASVLALLRNRTAARVDAVVGASLATAAVVLAAAVLLGSYDTAGAAAVAVGACAALALSWTAVREHVQLSTGAALVTATVALVLSNAATYIAP